MHHKVMRLEKRMGFLRLFRNQVAFVLVMYIGWLLVLTITFINFSQVGLELALRHARLNFLSFSTLPTFLSSPMSYLYILIGLGVSHFFIAFIDNFLSLIFKQQASSQLVNRISIVTSAFICTIQSFHMKHCSRNLRIWLRFLTFNGLAILIILLTWSTARYVNQVLSAPLFWGLVFVCYGIFHVVVLREYKNRVTYIVTNFALGLVAVIVYGILIVITLVLISLFVPDMVALSAFVFMLERLNMMMILSLFTVFTLINYALWIHDTSDKMNKPYFPHSPPITFKHRLIMMMLLIFFVVDVMLVVRVIRLDAPIALLPSDRITITAHRGFSAMYPENTLMAIERAIEVHADVVEFDIRITSNNAFVVIHDPNTLRTTGVNALVSQSTLYELTQLQAGLWKGRTFAQERIPSLEEVLALTYRRVILNIDLKFSPQQSNMVEQLIHLIESMDMQYQVILTSTCKVCLHRAKALNPNIQTGLITNRITPTLLQDPYLDIISMHSLFVDQRVVRQVHAANKLIKVWTVNDRSEIRRVSALGVNNIITSNPILVQHVLFDLSTNTFLNQFIRWFLN